ncbi:hypothetical protein ACIBSW_12605 [Actinoplanes sp. NPDC049668]|uniref:hypothetical protein n=1 Tax=unclassified Actinoplanes TaxID=2626549 RepID=UPI0033A2A7B7
MGWSRWPFADEAAFWDWAMDLDAELDSQDEDLLLHEPAGLPLLVAAADRLDCPKAEYCCSIVEDYAVTLIASGRDDTLTALRAAGTQAARGTQVRTLRLAAFIERLFAYREHPHGPVNRAMAERMAADLLSRPSQQATVDQLIVQITPNGKHWHGTQPWAYARHLYVNRRTGAWRLAYLNALSTEDLGTL